DAELVQRITAPNLSGRGRGAGDEVLPDVADGENRIRPVLRIEVGDVVESVCGIVEARNRLQVLIVDTELELVLTTAQILKDRKAEGRLFAWPIDDPGERCAVVVEVVGKGEKSSPVTEIGGHRDVAGLLCVAGFSGHLRAKNTRPAPLLETPDARARVLRLSRQRLKLRGSDSRREVPVIRDEACGRVAVELTRQQV